jgi:2-dehydropantoate 2-reductase
MRIAVMAAGAVGGYFGGRMAAAGHDVAFIARGAHRDAIRRDGLKIESTLGDHDYGSLGHYRRSPHARG